MRLSALQPRCSLGRWQFRIYVWKCGQEVCPSSLAALLQISSCGGTARTQRFRNDGHCSWPNGMLLVGRSPPHRAVDMHVGVCGEVSGMPRRMLQVPSACFMTSTPRCAALSQFARLQQANNDTAGGTSIGSQDKHEAQRRHAGLAVDMCRRATCRRGVPCGHMPATGIGAPCGHYLDAPAPPWGDF